MENKKTAVEWLVEQIEKHYILNNGELNPEIVMQLKRQAKEMEKEQKKNAYIEGRAFTQYTHDQQYGGIEYWEREPLGFTDYYNETYGQN